MVRNKDKMQPSTSKEALRKIQSKGEVPSRSYTRVASDDKNSEEYQQRRTKNNEAVRRSREKAKLKQDQISLQTRSCEEMTLLHKTEHRRLTAMIDTLRRIITNDSGPRDEALVQQIVAKDDEEQAKFKTNLRLTKQRHLYQLQQLQATQNELTKSRK